jgi:hypothetical protein
LHQLKVRLCILVFAVPDEFLKLYPEQLSLGFAKSWHACFALSFDAGEGVGVLYKIRPQKIKKRP